MVNSQCLLFDDIYYLSTTSMLSVDISSYASSQEHWENDGINKCYSPNDFIKISDNRTCQKEDFYDCDIIYDIADFVKVGVNNGNYKYLNKAIIKYLVNHLNNKDYISAIQYILSNEIFNRINNKQPIQLDLFFAGIEQNCYLSEEENNIKANCFDIIFALAKNADLINLAHKGQIDTQTLDSLVNKLIDDQNNSQLTINHKNNILNTIVDANTANGKYKPINQEIIPYLGKMLTLDGTREDPLLIILDRMIKDAINPLAENILVNIWKLLGSKNIHENYKHALSIIFSNLKITKDVLAADQIVVLDNYLKPSSYLFDLAIKIISLHKNNKGEVSDDISNIISDYNNFTTNTGNDKDAKSEDDLYSEIALNGYSCKLIYHDDALLYEKQIGIKLKNGSLFLVINAKGEFELPQIQANKDGISSDLYNNIVYALLNQDLNFTLKTEDIKQIINVTYHLKQGNHYLIDSFEHSHPGLLEKIQNIMREIKTKERDSVAKYSKEDIKDWFLKQDKNLNKDSVDHNNKLAETLAVIKRAMVLGKRIYPRSVQMISTLMLYLSDGGRLAQISTGEGKTTIVSMLAVLAILSGKENVDIVTSSSVNAQDGKESQEAFYEVFGLEADYNTDRDPLDLARVYRKQIVYGTVDAFEGDIIRQNTGINNDRGDRKIQFLIIDEGDNMLLDNASYIVMLSETLPRFEFLEPLLIAIYMRLEVLLYKTQSHKNYEKHIQEGIITQKQVISGLTDGLVDYINTYINGYSCRLIYDNNEIIEKEQLGIRLKDNKLFLVIENEDEFELLFEVEKPTNNTNTTDTNATNANITSNNTTNSTNIPEFDINTLGISVELYNKILAALTNQDKAFFLTDDDTKEIFHFAMIKDHPLVNKQDHPIPIGLREFAKNQAKNWADSAITAKYFYHKDSHYIINKDLEGKETIVLMDKANTGTVQHRMISSNGLHQFLQIKHLLAITPEELVINFMSNVAFFKKYGKNTFGMTGTLGTEAERNLMNDVYGVDFVEVPTFKPKNLEILPSLMVDGDYHIATVILNAITQINQERAVLLFAADKLEAEQFRNILIDYFNIENGYNYRLSYADGKHFVRIDISEQQDDQELEHEAFLSLVNALSSVLPNAMFMTTDLKEISNKIPNLDYSKGSSLEEVKEKLLLDPVANLDLLSNVILSNNKEEFEEFLLVLTKYNYQNYSLATIKCETESSNICSNLGKFTNYILVNNSRDNIYLYTEYKDEEIFIYEDDAPIVEKQIRIKIDQDKLFCIMLNQDPFELTINDANHPGISKELYTQILEALKNPDLKRSFNLTAENISELSIFMEATNHIKLKYDPSKIRLYTRNDNEESSVPKQTLNPGDIIISTNLAGRGTDLDTSKELEQNGGLHIIISFLPANLRVEWQIYGRTGRNGNLGTVIMILDTAHTADMLSINLAEIVLDDSFNVNDFIKIRDLQNNKIIDIVKTCSIPMTELQDLLYQEFITYISKYIKNIAENQSSRHNATIRQIEELWGIWLSNQTKNFTCNKSLAKEDYEIIKTRAFDNFNQYKDLTDQKYQNKTLINNPTYAVQDVSINDDNNELNRIAAIDPKFSFMAYYKKALNHAANNEGTAAKKALEDAKKSLEEISKIYRSPEVLLQNHDKDKDLYKQIIAKFDIVQELMMNLANNIALVEAIIKAQRENENGDRIVLHIESCSKITDLVVNHKKIRNDVIEFVNLFGSDEFCKIDYYVLPPEKDFFGNIMAIIISIAQIAIGFILPGSTVLINTLGASFMQHFSIGVIIGGISSAITTTIATIKGIPIEINQFIKGKLIELGATFILAGIQTGLEGLTLGDLLGIEKVSAMDGATFNNELIKRVTIAGVSEGVGIAIREAVKANSGNIAESVRKAVNEMMTIHNNALRRILINDIWNKNNNNNGIKTLGAEATNILASYRVGPMGLDHQNLLRSVVGGLGAAGGAATLYDMKVAYDDADEVTGKFCDEYGNKLEHLNPSDLVLMEAILKANNTGISAREEIIKALIEAGIIKDDKITDCQAISNLKIDKTAVVTELCKKVQQDVGEDLNKRQELTQKLTKQVVDKILKIIYGGIIVPMAHNFASFTWQKINAEYQESKMSDDQKKAMALAKARLPEQSTLEKVARTVDQLITGGTLFGMDNILHGIAKDPTRLFDKVADNDNYANKDDKPAFMTDNEFELFKLKRRLLNNAFEEISLTDKEIFALKYGYSPEINKDGKICFKDQYGNIVDVDKAYASSSKNHPLSQKQNLAIKYYQDKKATAVPHKVTQAINEGKEPVIGNDGNLYLIDESKGFAIPASIYEKTSSANNKPSYFKHPIAKGQTLSELAKHFKMSEKELLDANKDSVTNRHQIKESNYLNIPITPKNVHLFNNNAHYANNNQPSATFATNQDYTVSSNFVENMMQCGDGISCDSNGFDLSEAINDYVSKERQTLDGIKSEKNQASTELLLSLVDIPQILPDISDISLLEAVDKTLIAKMYFLWKNVAKVGYIMGKEQLASNYPALYKSLANTGNYIGDKIAFVFDNGDNIMHFISGDDYTDLKNNIKNGFDSLPVIGKDLTLMKLGEASGKVVWKATSSSVGAISKPLFNKIDDLSYGNIKIGDIRLDGSLSLASKNFFDNIQIYERKTAEVVNKQISQWYAKPPFADKTTVSIFKVNNDMQNKFVRLYQDHPDLTSLRGQFISLYDDIVDSKGNLLSAVRLKDKFDLPEIPTHFARAIPPAGTELSVGIVKTGNFGGTGKGTQFYFTERSKDKWFKQGERIK